MPGETQFVPSYRYNIADNHCAGAARSRDAAAVEVELRAGQRFAELYATEE
jgi:hypothetical protein